MPKTSGILDRRVHRADVHRPNRLNHTPTPAATTAITTDGKVTKSAGLLVPNSHAYTLMAPKTIEIFEVLDQTASAKLTARWGIDYLLLARYDGRWMISHVLWQSPPPATR